MLKVMTKTTKVVYKKAPLKVKSKRQSFCRVKVVELRRVQDDFRLIRAFLQSN